MDARKVLYIALEHLSGNTLRLDQLVRRAVPWFDRLTTNGSVFVAQRFRTVEIPFALGLSKG